MLKRLRQSLTAGTASKRNQFFPEIPLAGFGFLTHFVWEMLQVPWYQGMAEESHGSVVWLCIRATGGDVLIFLLSFWASSILCGNRRWLLEGDRKPALIVVTIALLATIVLEWLATGPLERWAYADSMPIIMLLEVGLTPLLQWVLLLPLLLWLTRRHMLGRIALRSDSTV